MIEPSVQRAIETLFSQSKSEEINNLQSLAENLAENKEEYRLIKKFLHEPTMKLRRGEIVDMQEITLFCQDSLKVHRKQQGQNHAIETGD